LKRTDATGEELREPVKSFVQFEMERANRRLATGDSCGSGVASDELYRCVIKFNSSVTRGKTVKL